jgi:acetyl esterase
MAEEFLPVSTRSDSAPNAQAQAVLDERARAGGHPMHEVPVSESRAAQYEWVPYMGPAQDVARVEDRFIPGPTAELPVRIFRPDVAGDVPALVAFHGGCWVVGNIDLADRPFRALANATGCVVVAVNYQKAPEHPFPVPLNDCFAGWTWTVEHAEELGIDANRIGVIGDSAGGNLAAAVSLKARASGVLRPAVQVLIYPALDWAMETTSARDFAEGYGLSTADMAWSYEQYVPDETARNDELVSPLRTPTTAGLPPAVVVTAGFDVLRDEAFDYVDRLREDGVPVRHLHSPGALHGFLWMADAVDEFQEMLEDVSEALNNLRVQDPSTEKIP